MPTLALRPLAVIVCLGAGLAAGGCRDRHPAPARARDAAAAAPQSAPVDRSQSLCGGERGLDHLGVAVPDLEAAARTYRERLGFSKPQPGKLPNGITNVNFYFGDATYLELLTHYDRAKATWLADFTDKHSGALFLVMSVYSSDATAAFLRRRGLDISKPVPGTIQTSADRGMPEEKWRTFGYARSPLPGDPLYFIAYNRRGRDEYLEKLRNPRLRRLLRHENTALGIRSVWLAVDDLDAAVKAFDRAGFPPGRRFDDPRLAAKGQVVQAGEGTIRFVAPAAPDGAVAKLLKARGGPGLLGATIEVGSVATAARVIGERNGRTFAPYQGLEGQAVLVPPELTHGVWLEFAERGWAPAR